jgi:hypothetical protein
VDEIVEMEETNVDEIEEADMDEIEADLLDIN